MNQKSVLEGEKGISAERCVNHVHSCANPLHNQVKDCRGSIGRQQAVETVISLKHQSFWPPRSPWWPRARLDLVYFPPPPKSHTPPPHEISGLSV